MYAYLRREAHLLTCGAAQSDRAAARTIQARENTMAPLPSNTTGILFVDYQVGGQQHTFQVRFQAPSTYADAMVEAGDWLTALGTSIYEITILGARVQAVGTNVTFPTPWLELSTYGSGTCPPAASAQFYDFVGRSPDGRRVRLSIFGAATLTFGNNYRASTGENTAIDAAVTELNSAEGTMLTISGEQPTWQLYANSGINAYWRNKIR